MIRKTKQGKLETTIAFIGIILMIILTAIGYYIRTPYLYGQTADGFVIREKVEAGTPVTLSYRHSVQKTMVYEYLVVNQTEDGLILKSTKYQSFGVGLPFSKEDGSFRQEGDWFIMENMNRAYPSLSIRNGVTNEEHITVGEKDYDLKALMPIEKELHLYVAPLWKGYWMKKRNKELITLSDATYDAENEVTKDHKIKKKLDELDKESNHMEYTGMWGNIIAVICICFSLFHLYTGFFGVLDAMIQRCIHLTFGISLVYLLCPTKKEWIKDGKVHFLDLGLAILSIVPPLYVLLNYQELILRAGTVTTPDVLIGILGIVMIIEAARRIVGLPIVIVVLCFIAYGFLGRYMPGALAHRGLTLEQMVGHLFYTTEGVFGIPMGVSSTFIFLFILFGAYLEKTGLGKFFIDIANAIAGWASGGPAKVAVISSALQGTISGSSVANVVGSGSFTIPMMKKLGYHKNFAGAVEAAASTGGQLMPPIMGAAAFLMAEFVNIPYVEVVKAAVVPAILYFIGVFLGVHFEAKRNNLKGTPKSELPSWKKIMHEEGHLALPLIAIIGLLVSGYTPMKAALAGIVISIIAAMLRENTRMSMKDIVDGLIKGARGALGVLIACASAGMIIGIVTKTGVGLKLASVLVELAGGNFMLLLVCTMITSLLLGMGVPTTANYVITSTIAAPALVNLGVPILAAHMFVFYFGIIADITPPVALAAFAGSAISGGDPLKTGVNASKLGIAAFIIPYVFVLSPQILGINAGISGVILTTCSALIGMTGISAAMIGYLTNFLKWWERILLFVGGIMLIDPQLITDAIGVALMGLALVRSFIVKSK